MMDALETLAYYAGEAVRVETSEGLAKRCGILDKRGGGIKNYIHRAEHPNQPHGQDRHYSPVMSDNVLKLLAGLRLTFAPIDDSEPTVAHICMAIDRLPIRPDAKAMAIHSVHRAGTMREGA